MVEFIGMRHLAIKVSDMQRSLDFYGKAFGMKPIGPPKLDRGFLPMASPKLHDQLTLVTAESSGETGRSLGKPGETGGIDHFGFMVSPDSDMEEVKAQLVEAGAEFMKAHDIAEGVPSMFFSDPDGYVFQVTRFPKFAYEQV